MFNAYLFWLSFGKTNQSNDQRWSIRKNKKGMGGVSSRMVEQAF